MSSLACSAGTPASVPKRMNSSELEDHGVAVGGSDLRNQRITSCRRIAVLVPGELVAAAVPMWQVRPSLMELLKGQAAVTRVSSDGSASQRIEDPVSLEFWS